MLGNIPLPLAAFLIMIVVMVIWLGVRMSGANRRHLADWHEHDAMLPVTTIDGTWHTRVWRRRTVDGKWEYKAREETEDEYYDRQW